MFQAGRGLNKEKQNLYVIFMTHYHPIALPVVQKEKKRRRFSIVPQGHKIDYLFLVIAVCFEINTVSAAGLCPAHKPETQISANFEKAIPQYNNELSRTSIESMQPKKKSGINTLGLTKSTLYWNIAVYVNNISRTSSNDACIVLTKITIDYGYGKTPVYIDKRYPFGGCHYKAVVNHENAHIAILNREGEQIRSRIVKKLESLASSLPPIPTKSPENVRQRLLAKVKLDTEPMLATFKERMEAAHAQLDSPQSMKMTLDRCTKW